LGGWIGDNRLGQKRAIKVGGTLMALGYLGLGVSIYIPGIPLGDHLEIAAAMDARDIALGRSPPSLGTLQGVAASVGGGVSAEALRAFYLAESWVFYASLVMIVLGNGLFKPNVSSLVGALYAPNDTRRDGGFTLFWTFINVGLFAAFFIGGAVGELVSWNAGFLLASFGMSCALLYFLHLSPRLPERRSMLERAGEPAATALTGTARMRLGAIVVLTAFAIVFTANHAQLLGSMGLFMLEKVDRSISGFDIPVLWITSINPLVILLLAPLAAGLWDELAKRGRNPAPEVKFVLAFAFLALGLVLVTVAAMLADGPLKAPLALLALAVMAMSIAEIPLQPIGLALVTQLSPPRFVGLMLGVWLLNFALGGFVGHLLGALTSTYGYVAIYGLCAATSVTATLGLLAIRHRLGRWIR
jgi:POT family proton-dependent oligopeptide transporter